LCDAWKRLKKSSATTSLGAFFLLLKKTIHAATTRRAPTSNFALCSNLFLDGFVVQADEETSDKEVKFTPPVSAPE